MHLTRVRLIVSSSPLPYNDTRPEKPLLPRGRLAPLVSGMRLGSDPASGMRLNRVLPVLPALPCPVRLPGAPGYLSRLRIYH